MYRPLGFALVATLLVACSDSTASNSTPAGSASLTNVNPAPAATAVSTTTAISLTFSQPMMAGMEQYLDLHQGTISDTVMPMTCGWNQEQTILTCNPADSLMHRTHYLIHVGGGMTDAAGHMLNMDDWMNHGGDWVIGGMMGMTHDGQPMGMMGPGWRDGSGHYGMTFGFTTE